MTPEQYCEKKVKDSGSSFYYSFIFLNKIKQREIFAIYAFCREVDDIADNISDKSIAQIKLIWWVNDLQKCYTENQTPEHPVNQELKLVINKYNLNKNIFEDLISGMQMDLDNTQYNTISELLNYCYKVAGTVGLMCVNIFGYSDKSIFKYSESLSNFLQLVNITRDCKEDYLKYNRIYIPKELLKKHNLSNQEFINILIKKDNIQKFKNLILNLIDIAENYYHLYKKQISKKDLKSQFPGYIMGEIYKNILDKIKKNPLLILNEKKISVSPLKKLYIAWKTNRFIKKNYNNYLKSCTQ